MPENATGKLRGFLWDYKLEIEPDVGERIIFVETDGILVGWANSKIVAALNELLVSGNDILALFCNDDFFFKLGESPCDRIKVVNSKICKMFTNFYLEADINKQAIGDVDLIFIAVNSYPSTVEIDGRTIEVTQDNIRCLEDDKS